MSTDLNYPASLRDIDEIHASARLLVEYAARRDVVVTIDLVPQRPLAMGNYAAAIKVWPRKVSAIVQALGAPQEVTPAVAWLRDDECISLMLMCVGIDASRDTVASWSATDAKAAAEWAAATHFSASDNDDVVVPPRPSFLPQPWKGPEGDPRDIMTSGPSATPVTA